MRWTRRTVAAMISGTFALAGLVSESKGGDLNESEFRRLHQELKPKPDEAWRTIPWKINLLDAQRASAEEGKPIFIWAMDGHPLGCT